ncbi:MAG: PUR family DNA/RNA-binding protein [Bacteroidales bacterium]|jgi:hypothetical protein|nr:PUR family DNA/RNA-binding protein [Bacteroidales bacterium]
MRELDRHEKNEILSRAVRAGKRTYFFDVKKTAKSEDKYLTITESKRKFNPDDGSFFYEKHKLFLYKEDFDKFKNALSAILDFIETGKMPDDKLFDREDGRFSEVTFEDIDA